MKNLSAFAVSHALFASVLMLCALASSRAGASEQADAMAPLRQFVDSFNKGDLKSAVAACSEKASVIDDFPPHEWQGNGCGKWAAGFSDVVTKEGITDARILLDKPRHINITGARAYVVVPVTLVFKHSGKLTKLPSMFTAALHKEPGGWRITGWAWADL